MRIFDLGYFAYRRKEAMSTTLIQDTKVGLDQTHQPTSINNQPTPLYLDDATRIPGDAIPKDSIGFARRRQSLDCSAWYNGWLMTFLATGEDTQGQFALIEAVGRKGNVPPQHIHHREDEIFYVLEGEMIASVGDCTIKGTPGTMIFLPRNVRHSFTIESEQFRMLILLTPAGGEGSFKEFSVPAPAMTLPPADAPGYQDVQRMLEVAPRYGLEFVPPEAR
jgi:quercetin dioxygenase-like cupin family protein